MAGKSTVGRMGRGYKRLRDAYADAFNIPKTNVDEIIRVRVDKELWAEIEAERARKKKDREAGFFGPF